MPRAFLCTTCRRALEATADAFRCPTCGRRFALKDDSIPRPRLGPPGMQARRDDEDDFEDYEDDDIEDDAPIKKRSKRGRSGEKPGKVQAVAIMTLIGGIYACVTALAFLAVDVSTCGFGCLWPGQYYCIVLGIMATIKGAQLIGNQGYLQPPPKGIGIMMIINIINLDIVNCVLGILVLVFCSDPEVESYYQG